MKERLMVWAIEHPHLALAAYVAFCAALTIAVIGGCLRAERWWRRRANARAVVAEAEAVVFEAARAARAEGL